MTYYVSELALWTLGAWFVGCIIGAVAQGMLGKGGADA